MRTEVAKQRSWECPTWNDLYVSLWLGEKVPDPLLDSVCKRKGACEARPRLTGTITWS